jgi:hypothetical protein
MTPAMPAGQKAITAVILGLPHPPSPFRPASCSGYFPVAISIYASQVTQCNHDLVRFTVIHPSRLGTFVDVNANKSLNGNERETPSTRPAWGGPPLAWGAGRRLPGGGPPLAWGRAAACLEAGRRLPGDGPPLAWRRAAACLGTGRRLPGDGPPPGLVCLRYVSQPP